MGAQRDARVDAVVPYVVATVVGDSMAPTLRAGDRLLCRRVEPTYVVRPGDVVLLDRPDRPGLVLVKRAVRREGDGWWVEGDNAVASDDSRTFGPVPDHLVLARVLLRWWPRPCRV